MSATSRLKPDEPSDFKEKAMKFNARLIERCARSVPGEQTELLGIIHRDIKAEKRFISFEDLMPQPI